MTTTSSINAPLQITINAPPKPAFWSGDSSGPSFKDVLDTINPLQHIPVISSIYQALTGDVPSTGAKTIGDTLFGGPVGLVASIFDSAVQQQTGANVAGNILAAIEGKPVPMLQNAAVQATQMASNLPPDHFGANQRAAYNAYVHTQSMMA